MEAPVSTYLTRPLRTLTAVCRRLGRDDNGGACAGCTLRDLCDPDKTATSQQPLSSLSTAP
jgi:hypothetical protein